MERLDLFLVFMASFLGSSLSALLLTKKKKPLLPKTSKIKLDKSPIFSPGPFGKNAKRKPRANDDEAGWRKENNMDLRDE
jgi:hypothetical protein